MKEIIKALKSGSNEATRSPYWLILDPKQNMDCNIHALAYMITGPFFCRADAETYLESRRYNFTKRAKVFCHSGHQSYLYNQFCLDNKI